MNDFIPQTIEGWIAAIILFPVAAFWIGFISLGLTYGLDDQAQRLLFDKKYDKVSTVAFCLQIIAAFTCAITAYVCIVGEFINLITVLLLSAPFSLPLIIEFALEIYDAKTQRTTLRSSASHGSSGHSAPSEENRTLYSEQLHDGKIIRDRVDKEGNYYCGVGIYTDGRMDEEARRRTEEVINTAHRDNRIGQYADLSDDTKEQIPEGKLKNLLAGENIRIILSEAGIGLGAAPFIWYENVREFVVACVTGRDIYIPFSLIELIVKNGIPKLLEKILEHEIRDLEGLRENIEESEILAKAVFMEQAKSFFKHNSLSGAASEKIIIFGGAVRDWFFNSDKPEQERLNDNGDVDILVKVEISAAEEQALAQQVYRETFGVELPGAPSAGQDWYAYAFAQGLQALGNKKQLDKFRKRLREAQKKGDLSFNGDALGEGEFEIKEFVDTYRVENFTNFFYLLYWSRRQELAERKMVDEAKVFAGALGYTTEEEVAAFLGSVTTVNGKLVSILGAVDQDGVVYLHDSFTHFFKEGVGALTVDRVGIDLGTDNIYYQDENSVEDLRNRTIAFTADRKPTELTLDKAFRVLRLVAQYPGTYLAPEMREQLYEFFGSAISVQPKFPAMAGWQEKRVNLQGEKAGTVGAPLTAPAAAGTGAQPAAGTGAAPVVQGDGAVQPVAGDTASPTTGAAPVAQPAEGAPAGRSRAGHHGGRSRPQEGRGPGQHRCERGAGQVL